MKKFSFRLEKLLDIKKAKEREIQHELAHEISRQNMEIEKQNRLREKIAEEQSSFHKQMQQHTGSVDSLMTFHRYSVYADSVIKDAQIRIENMQPKINEIRGRLNEAVKERRSIEKLKERKYEEWKYLVKREEDKETDELNMKIFNQQQREESFND